MTLHFGLGSPVPSGPIVGPGLHYSTPGACCYDADRPSWLPSWIPSTLEKQCMEDTNGCKNAAMTYHAPTPALPCASVNADGTCAGGPPQVNNKQGIDLSEGQPTNQQKLDAAAQAARDSVTGLTVGGCPDGQGGTYPDCGTCSWFESGIYPACSSTVALSTLALVAAGLFLAVGFLNGRR